MSSSNGQPPANPPEGEEGQPVQVHPVVVAVAQAVQAFAPHLSQEQALSLAIGCIQEDEQLQPVFQDAVNPQKREAYPFWGFQVLQRGQAVARTVGPKDLTSNPDLDGFVQSIFTIALLTSPVARAVIRAYEKNVQFIQTQPPRRVIV